MDEPPAPTPEQSDLAYRLGRAMVPLVQAGSDLPDAECAAAPVVATELRAEGTDPDAVDAMLVQALKRPSVGAPFRHDDVPATAELHEALTVAFKAAGGRRLPPDGLLVEKRIVGVKTGYPMYLFPNESKHPGFPHVTVKIGNEKVNISISENPQVIAGDAGIVGVGAVLKAVKKHGVELKREWDASRPDDQKLENFKANKEKAARADR